VHDAFEWKRTYFHSNGRYTYREIIGMLMGENGRRRCSLFTCPREKNKREDLLVGIPEESPWLARMFMTTGEPHREKFATWEIYLCNLPTLRRYLALSTLRASDKKMSDRKPFAISKNSRLRYWK